MVGFYHFLFCYKETSGSNLTNLFSFLLFFSFFFCFTFKISAFYLHSNVVSILPNVMYGHSPIKRKRNDFACTCYWHVFSDFPFQFGQCEWTCLANDQEEPYLPNRERVETFESTIEKFLLQQFDWRFVRVRVCVEASELLARPWTTLLHSPMK